MLWSLHTALFFGDELHLVGDLEKIFFNFELNNVKFLISSKMSKKKQLKFKLKIFTKNV